MGKIDDCLVIVRDWAEHKIGAGREPPWAWYQYMKLVEAVDSIRRGRGRVRPVEGGSPLESPQAGPETAEKKDASAGSGSERSADADDGPPPLPM